MDPATHHSMEFNYSFTSRFDEHSICFAAAYLQISGSKFQLARQQSKEGAMSVEFWSASVVTRHGDEESS
jgi:hypothetical protein